jgi:chromosome segregation ATPase
LHVFGLQLTLIHPALLQSTQRSAEKEMADEMTNSEQAKMISELEKKLSEQEKKTEDVEKKNKVLQEQITTLSTQTRQHEQHAAEETNYKRKFEQLASELVGEVTNVRSLAKRVDISDAKFKLDYDALAKDKEAEAKASADKSATIDLLLKETAQTNEKMAELIRKLEAAEGKLEENKEKLAAAREKSKKSKKEFKKAEEEIKLELRQARRLIEKKEKKIKRLEAALDVLGEPLEQM